MAHSLDIILFGASGFTGKRCISEIHRLTKVNGRALSWGIAGRSEKKLKAVLDEYQKQTDENLSSVPIIIADVKDYESIKAMTNRARMIINCCGPYRFLGEPVIKACIETGTHQVDVTGEPQYMESILLNYHKAAKEKGIYIVSACGFEAIPADLGVLFLQQKFHGTLNSAEIYLQVSEKPPQTPGPSVNYASWESALYGIAHANELGSLRRKLYPTRLPNFKPQLKLRPSTHKSGLVDAWSIPFVGSDRSVVLRSQRYLYETKKIRPVQVQTYVGFSSYFYIFLMVLFQGIFTFLAQYEFGRKLLLKYPKLFSFGTFSHKGPSEQKSKKIKFSMTFRGEGWSKKHPVTETENAIPPNKIILGRVSGMNPGYGVTCYAVTLAAIVILTETNKLPERGGVYPPTAAFADTSLIEQLQENGLTFEILSNE